MASERGGREREGGRLILRVCITDHDIHKNADTAHTNENMQLSGGLPPVSLM